MTKESSEWAFEEFTSEEYDASEVEEWYKIFGMFKKRNGKFKTNNFRGDNS